jgi:steroid delta-isomerase-like uncharacterized protein
VSGGCELVRRYLAAFWDSRWEELLGYLADDALYVDPLLPEPVSGKAAIRDVLAYCHEWGEYRGEIVNVFGAGSWVAVELRIRGRVTAPPEGMSEAVVGRSFDFAECDVFELDDGTRIVRQTIYADGLTLERQLGERFFP